MTLGTLFLQEDMMLKELLKGVTVTDQRSDNEQVDRPVQVWFGQPDQELRDQTYPYITIDMIDVLEDRARSHRGRITSSTSNPIEDTPAWYLKPNNFPTNKGFSIDYPIPVNIDYQITTYARHPRHDRALLAELLYTRLKFRFGTVIGDDDTVRRLDVLDVSKRDVVEQAKRLFVNAFTVRISSEIPQDMYAEFHKVQQISVTGPAASRNGRFTGVNFTQQTN
jgi:hypothetical protein